MLEINFFFNVTYKFTIRLYCFVNFGKTTFFLQIVDVYFPNKKKTTELRKNMAFREYQSQMMLELSPHSFVCYNNVPFPLMLVDNENGLDYDDEQSPSSPTNKSLPRSVSGTTVSSQGTQSGKSKKAFFKKVPLL